MNEVPVPRNSDSIADNFTAFVELVKILRRECPWDKKQTNESIAHLLIEESYETIDAIYKKDDAEFSKELGDLLLHVVMHAVMADERGAFNLLDVMNKIHTKLVYRHPHVFGEVEVSGEDEVTKNWEMLKLKEKGSKDISSILDGVPNSLPALLRAERIQHKAARVGFDWDDKNEVWKKVEEELCELKAELKSGNKAKATEELGDLFFAIVNAARHEEIVAEEALHLTNNKFKQRFTYIEQKAKESGLELDKMTLVEMDSLWNEAKKSENK